MGHLLMYNSNLFCWRPLVSVVPVLTITRKHNAKTEKQSLRSLLLDRVLDSFELSSSSSHLSIIKSIKKSWPSMRHEIKRWPSAVKCCEVAVMGCQAQQGLLCWPKHTQKSMHVCRHLFSKYVNRIILCSLFFSCYVVSTWLHCFQCCIVW